MENILLAVTVGTSARAEYNDRTSAFERLSVNQTLTVSIPALRNLLVAKGIDPATVAIAAPGVEETTVKALYDSGVIEYPVPMSLAVAYAGS